MGEQLSLRVPHRSNYIDELHIGAYELDRHIARSRTASEAIGATLENNAQRLVTARQPKTTLQAEPHMYGDLLRWNRPIQEALLETLEEPLLQLTDEIMHLATKDPEKIRGIATHFEPFIDRVPYAVASLPPNLFDYTDSRQPFMPENDLEAARLAVYCEYNSRHLGRNLASWPITHPHGTIGSIRASTIWEELVRMREAGENPFQSAEGMNYWHQYRRVFLRQLSQSRSDLLYNAAFVGYPKNRRFSEASGYFEKATKQAEHFCLLDIRTNNIFTTHMRTPIGRYGLHTAAKLTKAVAVMVTLIARNESFLKEASRLAQDESVTQLLDQHLLRANDAGLDNHRVLEGILHTALEGCISTATLLGLLTMDEIPGHPLPGNALAAIADAWLTSKLTALAPLGVAAPTGLAWTLLFGYGRQKSGWHAHSQPCRGARLKRDERQAFANAP